MVKNKDMSKEKDRMKQLVESYEQKDLTPKNVQNLNNKEEILIKMNKLAKEKYGDEKYLTISHKKASEDIPEYAELYKKYKDKITENTKLKSLAEGSINEYFYEGGLGSKNSVSSIAKEFENPTATKSVKYTTSQKLQSDEGMEIAIKRALKSGAPVNNLQFYDEVNWHLQSLGFDAKDPIDIKEAILNLLM